MRNQLLTVCVAMLIALGAASAAGAFQLLTNPGFEQGLPYFNGDSCGGVATVVGWDYSTINPAGPPYLCSGWWNGNDTAWGGGTRVHSGSFAVRAFHYNGEYGYTSGFRWASVSQAVDAVPNEDYTGSAWIYIYHDGSGINPATYVQLRIEELDASAVVVDTHEITYGTADVNQWLNPTINLKTGANTARIRFSLISYWYEFCTITHITYDDCALNGPAPPQIVQGTVTSGGSPLAGATVDIGGESTTTGPTGAYQLSILASLTDVTIRASKGGYYAQKKRRILDGNGAAVDFDLVAVANNLLPNAGVDDNGSMTAYTTASDGWYVFPTANCYVRENFFLDTGYPAFFRSGEMSAGLVSAAPPQEISTFQIVSVLPNSPYTASVWARSAGFGSYWYAGSDQRAALFVQELDKGGQLIGEHKEYLTEIDAWEKLTYNFTTTPGTAMLRVGGWANMIDNYEETLSRALFDDFDLSGAAGPGIPGAFGTVSSAGTPLSGAKVELPYDPPTYRSDVTDPNGAWAFNPPFAGWYYVRAVKPGYFTQRILRYLPSGGQVNFDLVERGDNLLVNAGFDDDPYGGGWIEQTFGSAPSYRRGETRFIVGETGLPAYYYSGEEAMALFTSYSTAGGGFWYHQSVPVVGGAQYTARVKTKISMAAGATSMWGDLYDDQVAGLLIKEYDSGGNLILEHPLVKSEELPTWETLEKVFNAQPQTATIKIGPYIWMNEDASANWWWIRATFDDVELRGPLGAAGLTGTVRSGAIPISGAVVTVTEQDGGSQVYITNPSGQYTASINYGSSYTVKASKAGYYPQSSGVTVTGTMVVDFDLYPVGGNLLNNPGFDDPYPFLHGGWVTSGIVGPETWTAQYGPAHFFTLPQAAYVRGPSLAGRVYQDVPVLPNQYYSAAGHFRPTTDARYGSVWGYDANQVGALFLQELNLLKQNIGAEQRQYGDPGTQAWQRLTTGVTTSANTAFIRVGGYAFMVDNYDANLARALFDQFELVGPAVPGLSIAQAKASADGTAVRILGKIVTAKFGTYYYIEEPDRSCGIRVYGDANVGDVVDVSGAVSTVDGEKTVTNASTIQRSETTPLAPLGTANRSLYVGLSTTGLFVKVWGSVTYVGGGFFTITDGSGQIVKVLGSASPNTFVAVTGAVGAELDNGSPVPIIRAVSVDEVVQ